MEQDSTILISNLRQHQSAACQQRMEAGDGGTSGGVRERGTVHGGQAHRLHACL